FRWRGHARFESFRRVPSSTESTHISGKSSKPIGGRPMSNKSMVRSRLKVLCQHAIFLSVFIGVLEWAVTWGGLDATFFGRPSGIAAFLADGFLRGTLMWEELAWSLLRTVAAFVIGSISAILTALLFL